MSEYKMKKRECLNPRALADDVLGWIVFWEYLSKIVRNDFFFWNAMTGYSDIEDF